MNLSPPPQDGTTPLLMASQNGHEEIVRLLLQSGAQDTPNKVCHYHIPKYRLKNNGSEKWPALLASVAC